MVYAAKVIKKDLKQSVYGSFFLMNMFFFVPLQNKNILRIIILTMAILLIVIGIMSGELSQIFNKAAAVCMECIGIG
jgi:hypothetical protein